MIKLVTSSFTPIEVKKGSSFQLKLKSVLKAISLPVLLLIACEYLVRAGFIEPYLLPAPSSLWQTFLDLCQADLWMHVWTSTWRVFLGFFIGSALALICAILVGLNKQVEAFLEPSFSAVKSIPSLGWIPLLLLWLGIDEASKITLIAIGAFFRPIPTLSQRLKVSIVSSSKSHKSIG